MVQAITADKLNTFFRVRSAESHKGNYGHACIIAGNTWRMGAAVIAAKACLRSGAGLLTVSIPRDERSILQTTIPEAMLHNRAEHLPIQDFDALGIGPAIGIDTESEKLMEFLLQAKPINLLIDADALTLLASHPKWFKELPPQTILTPHAKEFDRMFGTCLNMNEREQKAIEMAALYNVIIILKQHRTFITDGENCFRNTTGNSGLAKGGSGDALLGILTALRAQGYTAMHSCMLAVFLHGLAADLALQQHSEESMLITDVLDYLGQAFQSLKQ